MDKNDDLPVLKRNILDADAFFLCTPVYLWDMSGVTKTLIILLSVMYDPYISREHGRVMLVITLLCACLNVKNYADSILGYYALTYKLQTKRGSMVHDQND